MLAGVAVATVGGPTYIYDFKYSPEDNVIYYVSASQSGRGCPPLLQKISVVSGMSQAAVTCNEAEALITERGYSLGEYPAALFRKYEEIIGYFEQLVPLHLSKNGIAIDLDFVRTENYGPDVDEIIRTHFLASVHHNGKKIDEFSVSGCSREQPFTFAGYAIPGVEDALVLLRSGKGDCFEGGYTGEGLRVIRNVSGLETANHSLFWKGNEPLVPSEATLVVFEKDAALNVARGAENEHANDSSDRELQKQLLSREGATLALAAVIFTLVGIVLGRTIFRKREGAEREETESKRFL